MSDLRPRSWPARFRQWMASEATSGVLLFVAAAVALLWANSSWRDSYSALSDAVIGPAALRLDLPVASWATDGLLAIFFFAVGVELKHELVAGNLRNPRQAAVPMIAAVGGMVVPAAVFVTVLLTLGETTALRGWAIPTATDIAFALAVLAIFGRGLPAALRTFLLTLAVVDDLLAIVVIALYYTDQLNGVALGLALVAVGGFALVVRAARPQWWLLLPLALLAWGLMYTSGVHATIAGVLLGLTVTARPVHGEDSARTQRYAHAVQPLSSWLALPAFAFFATGVTLVEGPGVVATLQQPVVVAVILALVAGKFIGVVGVTALATRFTGLRLADEIGLRDLLPIGLLTGVGFTVSLLVTELSFSDPLRAGSVTIGVLTGTLLAAVLAASSLRWDVRRMRRMALGNGTPPDLPPRSSP